MPTPTNITTDERDLVGGFNRIGLVIRRRVGPSLAALSALLAFNSCGDDRPDAPGGSAPSADVTANTSPDGSGPANAGELSPESEDEAPMGAVPDSRADP